MWWLVARRRAPPTSPSRSCTDCTASLQFLLYTVGMGEQGLASFRQANVAANAVEQLAVELLFQLRHALAHRRLGQVQLFCRQGERAGFGNQQKSLEVLGVHYVFLLGIHR